MKSPTEKTRKRKFSKPLLCMTVLFQILLACVVCAVLVLYGPFAVVRRTFVGAAMGTYSHHWLAEMFYSEAQINSILGNGEVKNAANQKVSSVQVKNIDNADIELNEIKVPSGRYHGYMLVVSDPTRVHLGHSKNLGKVGETTSDIARDHKALAAINGGGFVGAADSNWSGTGSTPSDFLLEGGNVVWKDPTLDESSTVCNTIGIDNQGKLIVGNHTLSDLQKMNVQDAVTLQGYQPLVVNGQGVYKNDAGKGDAPRTAIGQRKDGTMLLLVLDGRQGLMFGATVREVQEIMLKAGAYTATCLDGGSSTTMFYNGEVVNNPCNALGERTVATAYYVTK